VKFFIFRCKKGQKRQNSERKIGFPIDFPSGLSASLRVSDPACRWQPSGRNDIENWCKSAFSEKWCDASHPTSCG